jgi:hypothetical protein
MRVFLIALLATIVLAVGSIFALNVAQRTTATAYTTEGARTNPAWSWRRLIKKDQAKAGMKANTGAKVDPASMQGDDEAPGAACEQNSALKWMLVDFSDSADDQGCNA